MLSGSYNHFDFTVEEDAPESPLVPNAPRNQFAMSVSYTGSRYDGALRYRHVAGFAWATGIFAGPVPSYDVVDLTFGVKVSEAWSVGVDASNALDNVHYEVFGGDLLRRRALVSLTYSR